MKIQFPFVVRQALQVATAVAEEIINSNRDEKSREIRPVLLSLESKKGSFDKEEEVLFRFEGGISVRVYLYNLSLINNERLEEWIVTQVVVRFWELDEQYNRISSEKKEQVWGAEKLFWLKSIRSWHHPHVKKREDIKGLVAVFIDCASRDGELDINPDHNQDGHYTLWRDISVEYSILVPEDLKKAEKKAYANMIEALRSL